MTNRINVWYIFCGIKLSIIVQFILALHFKNNAYKLRANFVLTKSIPEKIDLIVFLVSFVSLFDAE